MEWNEVLLSRKSTRAYSGERATAEETEQILRAAMAAPVACREYERYHFTLVENPALLHEIEEQYKTGAHPFYGAPSVLLISARMLGTEHDDSIHASVGCIAQNASLACTQLGLGSCLVWCAVRTLRKNEALIKKLSVPEGFMPVGSVCFGRTEKELPLRSVPEDKFALTLLR